LIQLLFYLALGTYPASGIASYYGESHRGKIMANGQPFNPDKMTGAMWDIPFGTKMRVTNIGNGKTVTIVITDRGPAKRLHRVLDVSEQAARELGMIRRGTANVTLEVISR